MTVIAHSYLLAKKYILEFASDRAFYKYAEQTGSTGKFILTDENDLPVLTEDVNGDVKKTYAKLEKINKSIKKTDKQIRKLYSAEYTMMVYATLGYCIGKNGHEKKWAKHNPLAFEAAVLATPFVFVMAIYALADEGVRSLQKKIVQKKRERSAR